MKTNKLILILTLVSVVKIDAAQFFNRLRTGFTPAAQALKTQAQAARTHMQPVINAGQAASQAAGRSLQEAVAPARQSAQEVQSEFSKGLLDGGWASQMREAVPSIRGEAGQFFGNLTGSLRNRVNVLGNSIKNRISGLKTNAQNAMESAKTNINSNLKSAKTQALTVQEQTQGLRRQIVNAPEQILTYKDQLKQELMKKDAELYDTLDAITPFGDQTSEFVIKKAQKALAEQEALAELGQGLFGDLSTRIGSSDESFVSQDVLDAFEKGRQEAFNELAVIVSEAAKGQLPVASQSEGVRFNPFFFPREMREGYSSQPKDNTPPLLFDLTLFPKAGRKGSSSATPQIPTPMTAEELEAGARSMMPFRPSSQQGGLYGIGGFAPEIAQSKPVYYGPMTKSQNYVSDTLKGFPPFKKEIITPYNQRIERPESYYNDDPSIVLPSDLSPAQSTSPLMIPSPTQRRELSTDFTLVPTEPGTEFTRVGQPYDPRPAQLPAIYNQQTALVPVASGAPVIPAEPFVPTGIHPESEVDMDLFSHKDVVTASPELSGEPLRELLRLRTVDQFPPSRDIQAIYENLEAYDKALEAAKGMKIPGTNINVEKELARVRTELKKLNNEYFTHIMSSRPRGS